MSVDAPQTQWRDPSGLVTFTNEDPNNIVDTADNYLVDPSGNFIVDTGVVETLIPATVWEEDDSV